MKKPDIDNGHPAFFMGKQTIQIIVCNLLIRPH